MKKTTFAAACLLALPLFAGLASAKTIKIPEEKPAASLNIPESWKPEETDEGVTCLSPDGEAKIFFEVTDAKGLDALIDENVKYLEEQKVKITKGSEKTTDLDSSGLPGKMITWDGKSEFGEESIRMYFVDIGKEKIMMITYWVTKKAEVSNRKALDAMFGSVKPL